ncbi:Leu/Phe/Val dehydrogenase [Aquisediminimonas profunda]|uniref:Leu/Phe/Val dehydrogenase n=1 Tax=Aquisediminimonas profunda TaxID=1550733 RepID=UPI001FE69416|nr:Glu/Leu/Phe/Val dehydrogenase dimerization domain-containing protein [Aquisediminimonas profunda]
MVHQPVRHHDFQEMLYPIHDETQNVLGVIAIHSTALGPAAGGCRLWHYESEKLLALDAVRLARGMSYKNAMAGLPFGGGKAVLQRPAIPFNRKSLFKALASAVELLEGQYVTAEDVGTTVADMQLLRQHTRYVAGLDTPEGRAGGDPSPWTAMGVFESMRAAVQQSFASNLKGLTVAVQGTGNVGGRLCRMLHEAGAKLLISDVDQSRCAKLAAELGATVVSPDNIVACDADILAPCALGGVLNEESIPSIKAKFICGGANNQLRSEADGNRLREMGIVYAPDYVVNSGGIINVVAEYMEESTEQVRTRVQQIAGRLLTVLAMAEQERLATNVVADRIAEGIIREARRDVA